MRSWKILRGCVLILLLGLFTLFQPLSFDTAPLTLFPPGGGVSIGLAQDNQEENVIFVGEAVDQAPGVVEGTELAEKRSLTSKTYQVGPDQYKAIISSAPMHYRDEGGDWQDIDTTIQRQADGSYYSGANLVRARFPGQLGAGGGIEVEIPRFRPTGPSSTRFEPLSPLGSTAAATGSQDVSVTWQPIKLAYSSGDALGAQEISSVAVAEVPATASQNVIVYGNAFPGVAEEFTVIAGGVKHSLVLSSLPGFIPDNPSPDAFLEYEVEMSLGDGVSLYVDGAEQKGDFSTSSAIELRRGQKEVVGYLLAPYAYESENPREAIAGVHAVRYERDRILVTVRIALSWLAAPDRDFPVVVDPTTNAYLWQDTFMSETYAYDSFWDRLAIYAGYNPPTRFNYGRERVLIHWSVDPIPYNSTITDARIWLYQVYSGGNASCDLAFYRMLNPWYSFFTSWNYRDYGTPWNSPGAGDVGGDYYGTGYKFSFDNAEDDWRDFTAPSFAGWVQGWIDGTYPNRGVMLKPSIPDSYVDCDRGFLTMNYDEVLAPRLEVDYDFTGGPLTLLEDNLAQTHPYPDPEHYYVEASTNSTYCSQYTYCWRGTALRPLGQSDYDLWLHTQPDFSEWRVGSRQGTGRVDYTLTKEYVTTTGYPRVTRFDGAEQYNIQYMLPLLGLIPPSSVKVTMGSNALWAVFELYLSTPGSWQVVVTPLVGNPDLGVAIHDPNSGDYHLRGTALAISDQIGQNLAERIEFTGSSSGFYGLVVWSNINTGGSQEFRLEVKAPSEKTYLPPILKNYVIPQGPFSNGGFENNDRWILTGELEHERSTDKQRSGSYSLRLGHDGSDPCLGQVPCSGSGNQCESVAIARQGFDVPSTGSPSLSFYYQIYTYDHQPSSDRAPDYFAAYIRDLTTGTENLVYRDDLGWVTGNYKCYNLNSKSSWQSVSSIDLSPYKGQTVELIFKVTNGGHNYWNTWAYIDDVTCSGC